MGFEPTTSTVVKLRLELESTLEVNCASNYATGEYDFVHSFISGSQKKIKRCFNEVDLDETMTF